MRNRIIILLSLPLAALVVAVSCIGFFTPNFYSAETLNWQAQSVGQDTIDLFLIVPCLVITSILSYRNNRRATIVWGGVVLYLTYTFLLYCFDVHFNKLFIVYCLCLGLSFYSFMLFLFTNYREENKNYVVDNSFVDVAGIYFILISIVFYSLWLSEIIPSIMLNTIPPSVVDAGLFTNGVHVIDLSILLPGIFIVGVFLRKRKPYGFVLAPMILTFLILMDMTIATLAVIMKMKGIESNLMLTVVMSMLTLTSTALLILFLKSMNRQDFKLTK